MAHYNCGCYCNPCCCNQITTTTTAFTTTTTTYNPNEPGCDVVIPAECIIYNGTFLEDYGINPGDSLLDILNLISQFLCECTTTTTSTTTTSTTSTTTSTSTTSTTTSTSTTTTTTTINPDCTSYYILNLANLAPQDYQYTDCFGTQISDALDPFECIEVEAVPGSFVLGESVVSGEGSCPLPLIITLQDYNATGVTDPFNVGQWNTVFNLPTNGTPFTNVTADPSGTQIYLYGGSGITLSSGTISTLNTPSNDNLIGINDQAGCIITCASLQNAVLLATVNLPGVTTIVDGCFNNCDSLTTITLPACTSLGSTTGDDGVFAGISGNTISLTIPTALVTDGDVVALQAVNTVTITAV